MNDMKLPEGKWISKQQYEDEKRKWQQEIRKLQLKIEELEQKLSWFEINWNDK